MLSISTSWMDEQTDIKEWLAQVKKMGFDAVELSYKVTDAQLKAAETVLGQLQLRVSSIHNFCPIPDDEPSDRHPSNHYRLSAIDERERVRAVIWTNKTIDTAKRLHAGVVVIHAGTCDVEDERSPKLFDLYVNGQAQSEEFNEEKARILELREVKKGLFIEALKKSLKDVMDYAQTNDVKIGLETRYYPFEIPNFDEIGYFLDLFGSKGMGYWHDVGHADMNERLGIKRHTDFLECYKDKLIGVHIHGIKGRRDHLAPFDGDMDLDQLLPYFSSDIVTVVESKPFADMNQMQAAVGKLKNL